MSPATLYGNIVMTIEAIFGLILLATSAGLVLARFSRPTARVMFSKVAVVAPYNGVPTLLFRLANERRNQILEAQVSVTLVRDERTTEGEWMRRFYDLQLARQRSPIFAMTFTVMHPIDSASPLWGATAASLTAEAAEIVCCGATVLPMYSPKPEMAAWLLTIAGSTTPKSLRGPNNKSGTRSSNSPSLQRRVRSELDSAASVTKHAAHGWRAFRQRAL